jgi:hypothetical protein
LPFLSTVINKGLDGHQESSSNASFRAGQTRRTCHVLSMEDALPL